MAYDRSKEKHEVLATLDKNDRGEKFQVSHISIKGSDADYVDIRLMYTPDGSEELKPTTKGVRFNSDLLLEVMKSLVSVLSEEDAGELTATINETFADQ